MTPMQIWFVIDDYDGPNSGTEKQLLLLIRGLIELGHEVRLFVLRHTPYSRSPRDFPCAIESLDVKSLTSLRDARRMLAFRARVRSERPAIVHAFFNDAAMLVPLYCKTEDTRIFTSRRDMGFWHTRRNLSLLRLANRRADGIICNSQAVAKLTHSREAVPLRKLFVIHNGLSLPMENHPGADKGTRIERFSPSRDGPNICLVANLRPIKRIEDLIEAASRVRNEAPEGRFWIVGETLESDYEARLRALVGDHGLGDHVHFLGESRDPISIMRQCQIGVLCSESEGLSNTILEYMSCGLAAVCSDVGGNAELIEHGVSGLLYPCGDVDALSRFLLDLVSGPDWRDTIGAAAKDRARAFSVAAMVDNHECVYADPLRARSLSAATRAS